MRALQWWVDTWPETAGGSYYYLFDGLGSVVGLVDSTGTLVARYGYDPYGQTITKTGTAAEGNPFRYTGAYLDATGLYHMGARYYDPARGRFTQLDPLGHGYVYASDNPVNFTDPSGLDNVFLPGPGDIVTTFPWTTGAPSINFGDYRSGSGGEGPRIPPEMSGTGFGFYDADGNYYKRVLPNACVQCDAEGNGTQQARFIVYRPDGSRIPGETRWDLGIPCDPTKKFVEPL